jgi:hypothetical protein
MQMEKNKALRPDGFPGRILSKNLCQFVFEILQEANSEKQSIFLWGFAKTKSSYVFL